MQHPPYAGGGSGNHNNLKRSVKKVPILKTAHSTRNSIQLSLQGISERFMIKQQFLTKYYGLSSRNLKTNIYFQIIQSAAADADTAMSVKGIPSLR